MHLALGSFALSSSKRLKDGAGGSNIRVHKKTKLRGIIILYYYSYNIGQLLRKLAWSAIGAARLSFIFQSYPSYAPQVEVRWDSSGNQSYFRGWEAIPIRAYGDYFRGLSTIVTLEPEQGLNATAQSTSKNTSWQLEIEGEGRY